MAEQEWQPIAEATAAHYRILGYQATPGDWENQMGVCWHYVAPDGTIIWCGPFGLMPTHFQPLPAPPSPQPQHNGQERREW